MKKRFLITVLMVCLLWAAAGAAMAAQPAKTQAWLNGQPVELTQPPFRQDGVTMVPMRLIFEALGAEVTYDAEHRNYYNQLSPQIEAQKDKIHIIMKVGSDMADVGDGEIRNGQEKTYWVIMDSYPVVKNGVAFVPLRAVSDFLFADVDWEESSQTITISQDGQTLKFVLGKDCVSYTGTVPGPENFCCALGKEQFEYQEALNREGGGGAGYYNNWDGYGSLRAYIEAFYKRSVPDAVIIRSEKEWIDPKYSGWPGVNDAGFVYVYFPPQ